MSLRIRLARVGAKKQASYRIVVADSTAPRGGAAIAILGNYNPLTDPYTLNVKQDEAVNWLKKGAQPSETARGLLSKAGVMAAFDQVRKGQPEKHRITTEEAKARREARAKRTGPARLVRPARREGEAAAAAPTPARPTAAKTATRARSGGAKTAGAKTAPKAAATGTTRRRTTKAAKGE